MPLSEISSTPPHWSEAKDQLSHLCAVPRFGLISDFDGTLSELTEHPNDAVILLNNATALDALAQRIAIIALISGRSALDLYQRFPHQQIIYYGNHGLERWTPQGVDTAPEVAPWVEPLKALLREFAAGGLPDPAVLIENKGATAAIHYRMARDPQAVQSALQTSLAPLVERFGLQMSEGHLVWEIKPPLALDKGTAAAAVVHDHALDGVLFLGDDTTDIAAMKALRTLRKHGTIKALSIGVAHSQRPLAGLFEAADLIAHGPHDVAELLRELLHAAGD
ncbi:MAG: trehalose-phosphatase [Aggregatilineales bacterium]